MADIECEHCGGTDFYKEAGYFFCKGCQVQSQEVQEYVFEEYAPEKRPPPTKVQSVRSEKVDNKITSWECYNYILLGLTEELIKLGADKKLKSVVKFLWLRYLEKLRVFERGKNELPRLQAVCSGIDGEIVYGKLARRKRKRNKSSSSDFDVTTLDSSSVKYERTRRKRALVKAQYEDYTQKSQGTASLHNETLTSLQTGSEKSSKVAPISYNIYASKEMKRIKKSKFHWHRHRVDYDQNLKCHRLSYRKISHKYRVSPYIISLNKLHSILYIGLLILKDKIQLSDLFRYIKEGHLSFNCYDHLFPDEFSDRILNFRNFKKNCVFSSGPFRTVTLEMAIFLNVHHYVSRPDLVELCDRYCKELNLPDQICDCVKNIISKCDIRMYFRKKSGKVPNYEGRILSIILFVIKLLFGLDDVTEFNFGKYSEILNTSEAVSPKMFNVIEWLKYLEYRSLVMRNHHFPTNFYSDPDVKNVNLSLDILARKEYPSEIKHNSSKDNYKQVLEKLKSELDKPQNIEFPVTLTPFLEYSKYVPKNNCLEVLSKDFSKNSLIHILRPSKFLKILNKNTKVEIVNGGANDEWVFENLICPDYSKKSDREDRGKFVTVKLNFHKSQSIDNGHRETKTGVDSTATLKDFQAANNAKFARNADRLNRDEMSTVKELNLKQIRRDLKECPEIYSKHYNPYEMFWMRNRMRIEFLNQKEFKKFFEKFPNNFRLVFKECQRIAQQSEQELLTEYQFTELYLAYAANYGKKTREPKVVKERLIANYLDRCKHLW